MTSLSWQLLHGHGGKDGHGKNWEGLLPKGDKPGLLDPDLRAEILKYGELAQATYDGFDHTANTGKNHFPVETLLQNCLPKTSKAQDYTVVKYLWATSGVYNITVDALLPYLREGSRNHYVGNQEKANLVGFIAHSKSPNTDGIDVAIVWRGTIVPDEWVSNIAGTGMKDWPGPAYETKGAKVHTGFLDIYANSMLKDELPPKQDIHLALDRLLQTHKVRSITTTGHSLGAALAIISAAEIAQFLAQRKPTDLADKTRAGAVTVGLPSVCSFAFAPPQPGNHEFLKLLEEMNVPVLRVTNEKGGDVVPKLPNPLWTEVEATVARGNTSLASVIAALEARFNKSAYQPVGVALQLDSGLSKILKPTTVTDSKTLLNWPKYLGAAHNLELYLWLVATQHGGQKEPTGPASPLSKDDRDWALLNKSDDELRAEFNIPANWWAAPNHGGLVETQGRWRRPATA